VNAQAKKNLSWLYLSVLIIALDLLSKNIASTNMVLGESIPVLSVFNWTLAHNYGAAFSFLADAGGWQRWFFAVIALVVSVGIIWWLKTLQANSRFLAISLALVLGGAIGNLYDRIALGYVVDFIHLHYGTWDFPAFNLADSAITVGAIMLVIDSIFFEGKRQVVTND
jgi:signal peptidase II